MLILRRKKDESILIGDNIRITIVECGSEGVRIAIDAPKQISILREELSKGNIEKANKLGSVMLVSYEDILEKFNQGFLTRKSILIHKSPYCYK